MLAADFDMSLLAALNDQKATFAKPHPSPEQFVAAKSALLSNLRFTRVEALNQAMQLDNELYEDERLSYLEQLYDLEQHFGLGEK